MSIFYHVVLDSDGKWIKSPNNGGECCTTQEDTVEALNKLIQERDALQARVERLEEALEAYQEAYTPDGHFAPHDCFSTGPKTGHGFQDHVWCPGCYAESLAKQAKESKP